MENQIELRMMLNQQIESLINDAEKLMAENAILKKQIQELIIIIDQKNNIR